MSSDASSYWSYVQRHRRFLRDHPDADTDRRKRPLRFIAEDAVEGCLWPRLYWDRCLCETSVRLADIRSQTRARAAQAAEDAAMDSEPEDGDAEQATRQSLRRSFLAYAGDHELVHFVFDLFLWSDVGGKKGALRGTPMWKVMKGAPWTPQPFWTCRRSVAIRLRS